MIGCHANFQRYNPMRPPDWRWQRALSLVENGHNFCRQHDDDLIGRAMMLLRSLEPHATPRRVRRLRREISDVVQAHEFFLQAGVPVSIAQARILAGQESSQIGRRLSVSAAVIDCYQKLFFDVSERLQARSYIQLQAVGLPVSSDSREQRIAKAFRSLAFNGGPVVYEMAEAVLFGVGGDSLGSESYQLNDRQAARMRLLVELLSLPFDLPSLKTIQRWLNCVKPPAWTVRPVSRRLRSVVSSS